MSNDQVFIEVSEDDFHTDLAEFLKGLVLHFEDKVNLGDSVVNDVVDVESEGWSKCCKCGMSWPGHWPFCREGSHEC